MIGYLQGLAFWDWLGLGTLLLIFEVFGAGGYLLWTGIAAASVGILTFFFPGMHWALQFVLFGVLSILSALYWWWQQRASARESDQPHLNRRGSELIGREFVVHEAIIGGRGKIKVGDSLWLVSGEDLPAGSPVRVIGQDGVLLQVAPQ